MAVTTEGTPNPTRLLSIHPRVIPAAVITVMTRCETPQILLHQTKCEDQTVLKISILTVQDMVKPKACTFTESVRGMEGPVFLHKKIHITTVLFIVQIHILLLQAKLLILRMILQMTGLSILVLLGKNIIITAELKFPSGKNLKSGLKESKDKKRRAKWQLTVSPRIEITEEKQCKLLQLWRRNIPVIPARCSHRISCPKQAGTMTETTDCQEQTLTVVLPQCNSQLKQRFTQLLPQARFLLALLQYSLIILLQRNLMMQMELLYPNCLHPHLPYQCRNLKGKKRHLLINPPVQLLPHHLRLD